MVRVAHVLGERYELGRMLGGGGMGAVYEAHDRVLDRAVAVKLSSRAGDGAAGRERFRREARAAASLAHPNVVTVFDWGDENGSPFIVMELVEGSSLHEVLSARGRLAPGDVARIGAQVADALAHAHSKGVVHRDVKPGNILLTRDGVAKVTDFGIASVEAAEPLTAPGVVVGTAAYLAPELARGARATPASDVYALGVVLFQLCTGLLPSAADTVTLAAVRDGPAEPPPLHAVPDPDLALVLARALAPARRRYRTAGELRDDLRRITGRTAATADSGVSHAPTVPDAPPTQMTRTAPQPAASAARSRSLRRSRTLVRALWAGLFVVVLAAGAAGGYAVLDGPRTVRVPDVVDHDLHDATQALAHRGLAVQRRFVDDARPAGLVVAQHPANSRRIAEGDPVVLTVSRRQASVPDVVGEDAYAARDALARVGFVNVTVVEEDRAGPTPGSVLSVNPPARARADKTTTVTVVVARDPNVRVLDVVGLDQAAATARLRQAGVAVLVRAQNSTTVAAGIVMSTSPRADDVVLRGDPVTIVVSSGPKPVAVPSTVGKKQSDAASTLQRAGFSVSVAYVAASKSQVDKVVAQSPATGQAVPGTTVTITVGR